MSRLIDADKIDFREVFKGESDFAKDTREAAQSLIDRQPTVEAVPAVHGEWNNNTCSACGMNWDENMVCHADDFGYFDPMPNFCPNCGADMRKKV